MSLDTDKRRLSQIKNPQNMRRNLSPEHIFKQRYDDLQKASQRQLGWQWLLPLHTADAHHLKSLRIPTTDEQRDFEAMVLSLTKILIDSLSEKSLMKWLDMSIPAQLMLLSITMELSIREALLSANVFL